MKAPIALKAIACKPASVTGVSGIVSVDPGARKSTISAEPQKISRNGINRKEAMAICGNREAPSEPGIVAATANR